MARGYLPIVALTDGQQGSPPSSSTTNSPTSSATTWRAKGKGKGGKKGKSKTTVRYPPQGAGKFDPKGRAKANLTCLRCGQPGHWAANCPQGSSSPTSRTSTKRPASTTEGMAHVVPPSETALLIFQDSEGRERPDCVMLDPGASAFLSGYGPFSRLLTHYKDIGYPVDCIKMTKGRRRFQFGGDASQWSDWSAHIPVFVDGKYGTIEAGPSLRHLGCPWTLLAVSFALVEVPGRALLWADRVNIYGPSPTNMISCSTTP